MLGQDDIMLGKEKGMESFTSTIKQVLAVMPSSKDQTSLISSLFNVWEENVLSLGEGPQEDLGMNSISFLWIKISDMMQHQNTRHLNLPN